MHDHVKNGPGAVKATEPAPAQPRTDRDRIAGVEALRKAHLEYLVAEVASQLLAVPLPGIGASSDDIKEWALARSRNVLTGLMGQGL